MYEYLKKNFFVLCDVNLAFQWPATSLFEGFCGITVFAFHIELILLGNVNTWI